MPERVRCFSDGQGLIPKLFPHHSPPLMDDALHLLNTVARRNLLGNVRIICAMGQQLYRSTRRSVDIIYTIGNCYKRIWDY
ncbi:hypothetical protein SAMN02745131_02929 [Flavisolibacter ginsengisoli DSM 18119]|jgi:hypothetical protein|uniref:Uncharacterized protein n=1 Tax=Flavisolibacter ginsengisoli DSM 18119 TaxID=1121884 RepID=A0A1M5CG53_9BACT|nr:hypothetical protein SAMN02745131_02929 [Flavisolibacter ginsengisoli DSM 18119]